MKSDFTYHTIESQGINVLVIIDLDQGGASVTNNAEAVVKSIAAELGEQIFKMPIIYRDSEGAYDGIDGTYLEDPFYSIGSKKKTAQHTRRQRRYWTQNIIHFSGRRAWKRGDRDEIIKVPEKLQEIQNTWAEWQNAIRRQRGSCVLAGFEGL